MWKEWIIKPPWNNSKVTVELRELIESGVDVWDFEYPSYYKDAAKRDFEQKVLDHYLFRQIGQETPARWLHYFRTRIREIMPYYIQLYESAALMAAVEDPFEAYNLTEEYTETTSDNGKVTGKSSDTSESTSEGSRDDEKILSNSSEGSEERSITKSDARKYSNTPQNRIDNIDEYLTDYTENDANEADTLDRSETASGTEKTSETSSGSASASSSGTSESTSENSGEKTYRLTRRGNIGVQPLGKEVQALRESFLNIDLMIINELQDLFLKVY